MNPIHFFAGVGVVAAIISLPGTIELLFLTLGAMLPRRNAACTKGEETFRLAVVIPAHNEESQIRSTLNSVFAADRSEIDLTVVVVADNCTDGTASEAQLAGARILVRSDHLRRGKGYALDHAFQILLPESFGGFLIVDADTEIAANTLRAVVAKLRSGADAVQCRYLVRNPGDSMRTRLMSVALMAFNVLRLRGRERWGLSCGINGNGFALNAETLRAVPYGAASVVEDLEYHLDLVRAGRRVHFADNATVFGEMPAAGSGVKTQRTRWEGGRFRMLAARGPGLAKEVLRGRWTLGEPLGDLLLLPLAFHVTLLTIAAATPSGISRIAGVLGLGTVVLHLITAIVVGGGGWREIRALAAAPFYVVWKLMLLPAVLASSRSGTAWVRTERSSEEGTK